MVKSAAPEPSGLCLKQHLNPVLHVSGCFVRKCNEQYILRMDAFFQEVGDAIDKGPGLPAAGAGKHKARALGRLRKALGVEV